VGHPLAGLPAPTITREQFASENNLDPAKTWIGLLPGSRLKEIQDHLPELLLAARILSTTDSAADTASYPREACEFLIPLASTLDASQRATVLQLVRDHGDGLSVRLVDEARAALFHARASVVASGTATVEAALIGNPFVVVYRVSPVTYAIAKRVVKVPHVAMANLIAGKRVVPELIQNDFTAANIVQHLKPLLPDGPARESMRIELRSVRAALLVKAASGNTMAPGAIERVGAVVIDELEAKHPPVVLAGQP
jgi:lipid-A-disaccharide synthase